MTQEEPGLLSIPHEDSIVKDRGEGEPGRGRVEEKLAGETEVIGGRQRFDLRGWVP